MELVRAARGIDPPRGPVELRPVTARLRKQTTMNPKPVETARRFTMMDAMILVAATAVALMMVRPVFVNSMFGVRIWTRTFAAIGGGLVAWTPTVLLLRLRPPRPTVRRLARQPGFVAGVAVSTILALYALAGGIVVLVRTAKQWGPAPAMPGRLETTIASLWAQETLTLGLAGGLTVIATWVVLAVGGRCRPSRDWLDILGRVLGILWIVLFVIYAYNHITYFTR